MLINEKYNRIVLIGNGLDRALGLKTSYSDFILYYLKTATINQFKEHDNSYNLISFEDVSTRMVQNIGNYSGKLEEANSVNEFLRILNREVKIKYKYEFFRKLLSKMDDALWVDIERYYYDSLNEAFRQNRMQPNEQHSLSSVIALNNCMDEITTALNDFIKIQQRQLQRIEPVYTFFRNFSEPLKGHIATLVNKHSRSNKPSTVLFLNFNYTNTVKQIIDESIYDVDFRHTYIHGTVNHEEHPIIFGYGDDTGEDYKKLEIDGENELIRLIKSFKYPRTYNYHNLLNYLENCEYDVFIVGHSCGLSDRTLLKTIFEHRNCLAIQNYHYKGEPEDFDKRMEISRHFSDKVLMRERVLPYDNFASIPQCRIYF